MDACLLYSTHPSTEQAEQTARALIEQHLAACCNILPGITSMYRWEGAVATEAEVAMVSKTTHTRAEAAIRRIEELHPYDTPAILLLPISGGAEPFLAWIAGECSGTKA